MSLLDWAVLVGSLVFIVVFGTWKNRHHHDLDSYLVASRNTGWKTIALSVMATQASAITFLSTPGQAYADGMRFVQFYFGLPLAMVVLCVTAVPIYHRLKVYTAYEYLEKRFDPKTRSVATFLFLVQRGLSTGLSIYATAIVLSVILGWNIYVTNLVMGGLVVVYTSLGGAKAVNWTQSHQFLIAMAGVLVAMVVIVRSLPDDVSFLTAAHVAGKLGRMRAIDFSFDLENRYNVWSGLIGGFFLQLSYFGTDQSQVGRYLGGRSIAESRMGLLFNGLVKIPMQFFILFLGAMVFVFFQFTKPPVFFNPVEVRRVASGPEAAKFHDVEVKHDAAFQEKRAAVNELVSAMNDGVKDRVNAAESRLAASQKKFEAVRGEAVELVKRKKAADANDTNYIFLNFVIHHLPVGLVGLILAVVFAASMSSNSAAMSSLASTTCIDVYSRLARKGRPDEHYVRVSKLATVFWGVFAVIFAEYADHFGTLIEVVNILGSLVYPTILGLFLLAFYFPKVRGTAAFWGAIVGELVVIGLWRLTSLSFLWYNVVGCVAVMLVAFVLTAAGIDRSTPSSALTPGSA